MHRFVAVALVVAVGLLLAAFDKHSAAGSQSVEQAIRDRIQASYFQGAFNAQNTTHMKEGFHPDFAIFSAKGEDLARYEISTWIEGIEKRKQSPEHDAARAMVDATITSLDVTGGAASARIEIRKQNKLIYTDYLSLLKFPSGWKIVAKVYHAHK
jgi:hypothetical protein